ncbi:unnamed protein product [Paramecium sonneborni]|uniref:Uncharacterized protein n=1 Tax=Paramecium sonneborni TaxID=65129 RepID=A0A8S1NX54_9CILI|nr:unnamed protein product [Paramecium sonneborni]
MKIDLIICENWNKEYKELILKMQLQLFNNYNLKILKSWLSKKFPRRIQRKVRKRLNKLKKQFLLRQRQRIQIQKNQEMTNNITELMSKQDIIQINEYDKIKKQNFL